MSKLAILVRVRLFGLVVCIMCIIACNSTNMTREGSASAYGSLNFNCAANENATQGSKDLNGMAGTEISVKGQFCNVSLTQTAQATNLLFLVDASGSMRTADPFRNGTCARLDGARYTLEKLAVRAPTSKVALATFGTSVHDRNAGVFMDLSYFQNQMLTADNFCVSHLGNTNFEAAFAKAKKYANSVNGQAQVLFWSDGMPTMDDRHNYDMPSAKQSAKEVADELRVIIKNNVYITYLQSENVAQYDGQIARSYLESLVGGDSSKVSIARDASEFLTLVQEKSDSLIDISSSGVSAELSAPGFSPRSVPVTLQTRVNGADIHNFVTDKFQLFGLSGQTLVNTLTVSVKDGSGRVLTSTTSIRFTQR